ncbi:MAG: chondroitinase-B domain-containing protein [Ignavibacteria bacterium]|nr:chondroitinase-B domain-containing protein [Ignavibacteria bacterium]
MIKQIQKILLLVILVSISVNAKEFFVTTSTELSSAISLSKPGDVIVMKNGIWQNVLINFQNDGNSSFPITLKAEKKGEVIISGKSNLRIAGNYLVVDGLVFKNGYSASSQAVVEFRTSSGIESNYSRLTNTSIVDYNPTDTKTDYKWISLYGTHNRVDHCYLKGKTHIGTTLVVWLSNKPNYHLIDSNYFAYRPVFPENGAETIRIGTSDWSLYDSFTTVEYNYFEECNGETEIISSKSCGNIYRYNTFKNCEGTLTLRHGNRCTVEGNFFLCGRKTNSGGIRIIGEDHKVINNYIEDSYGTSYKSGITMMNGVPNSPLNRYYQVKRAVVAFNTVVNAKMSLNIGAGKDTELTLPPLDCIIANNIFYSSTSPLVTFTDTPINITWSGNVFNGASIGMALPADNYNFNPQLVKGSDNIYRLQTGSMAIDKAGSAYNYTSKDFDGQTRIINDIGADEFSSDPVVIKSVSEKEVGPEYLRTTSVEPNNDKVIAASFRLDQNYPNPFNPSTVISYEVKKAVHVSLKIYDLLCSEIATLVDEYRQAGSYNSQFSIFNSQLGSGVYFYTLKAGDYSETKKMVLLK